MSYREEGAYPHLRNPWWWSRLTLTMVVMLAAMSWLHARVGLGLNTDACIPEQLFIVAKQSPTPERGAFFSFLSQGAAPYEDGTVMLKLMLGMPGDRFQVTGGRVLINGVDRGIVHPVDKVQVHKGDVDYIIPADHFALLGTTPESYDSRYWGLVHIDQLRGKAWAVF